jgi:hypothetical protein
MARDPYWFSDFATLSLQTSAGTTELAAGIKGATIEAEHQTLERLYTADSTKIESQKQAEFQVPIELNYVKFEPDFVKQWLGGSGGDATVTSYTDTSDPQKYTLSGDFDNADGTTQVNITVEGITFPSIPVFDGEQDEFVEWGLSGAGEDITTFDTTTL